MVTLKRERVLEALQKYGGDLHAAAHEAGCSTVYVRQIAKQHGISLNGSRGCSKEDVQAAINLFHARREGDWYVAGHWRVPRITDVLAPVRPVFESGTSLYADAGTIVHEYVSATLMGLEPDFAAIAADLGLSEESAELAGQYEEAALKFTDMVAESPNWSEVSLASTAQNVGATIDIIALAGSRPVIYELKTGASYPWHYLQLAGQQAILEQALKAVVGHRVEVDGAVVYLKKDGRYTVSRQHEWGKEAWRSFQFLRSHNLI